MRIVRRRVSRTERLARENEMAGPLMDRHLGFVRHGQRWSFQNGRIMIGTTDLNDWLALNPAVSYWVAMAEGLAEYRRTVAKSRRVPATIAQFYGMADALLAKIYSKVRDRYAEKTSGLVWSWVDGHFLLNDLNVAGFLAMYRQRPTHKGWRFLKGLQGKLELILAGCGSSDLEKVRPIVQDLYQEICRELDQDPPPDPRGGRLTDGSGSR